MKKIGKRNDKKINAKNSFCKNCGDDIVKCSFCKKIICPSCDGDFMFAENSDNIICQQCLDKRGWVFWK